MDDFTRLGIKLEVNSFNDLKNALESFYGQIDSSQHQYPSRRNSRNDIRLLQQQQQQQQQHQLIPMAIRDTVESASFLASLMEKARSHWCCVGFKVAPVTLDVIQNWRQAPITIVYCVASIALVTFMDHNAGQAYVKTAAMEFYEQARRKMDDIVFDDESDKSNYCDDDGTTKVKSMTIQSYFCLSYTSNLLRLYEQQRTWGGLASIALQLRTKDVETGCRPMDQAILLCFCRWYYVDAWMALTLQRDCLLPDEPPQFILDTIQSSNNNNNNNNALYHQSHYQFVMLARFIRRYIRIMQSGKLMEPITMRPSSLCDQITNELKQWYALIQQEEQQSSITAGPAGHDGNVHFHLCYNAMRLVILYKLLQPDMVVQPDDSTLIDGLETNLALLLALRELASRGCDQSTYHHMFFAIHNIATRIHQHHHHKNERKYSQWQEWATQQLQMNLVLLKGTQAYVNDVFQMRVYAEKIEQQFAHMGLQLADYYQDTLTLMTRQHVEQDRSTDKRHKTGHATTMEDHGSKRTSPGVIPGMHVYKLHTSVSIKKSRKTTAKKIKKNTHQ
ncbi:hypothetical protein BC941DRAFT_360058 [Chlamydoabsidia padenii]|nr:hypothetical protein BC941DRAFT_360058 [Chlamydoabsidia padenii]